MKIKKPAGGRYISDAMIRKIFYNIKPCDGMLILQSIGKWNGPVAKECFDDLLETVMRCYPEKPYALIYDITNWELSTPDAVEFWMVYLAPVNIKENTEFESGFCTMLTHCLSDFLSSRIHSNLKHK